MACQCSLEDFEDEFPTGPGKTEEEWKEYYKDLQVEQDKQLKQRKHGKHWPPGTTCPYCEEMRDE